MEPDGEEGEGQDDADHGDEGQDPPTQPLNQVHASKYSLMQSDGNSYCGDKKIYILQTSLVEFLRINLDIFYALDPKLR